MIDDEQQHHQRCDYTCIDIQTALLIAFHGPGSILEGQESAVQSASLTEI